MTPHYRTLTWDLQRAKRAFVCALACLVAGCGGSGSSSDPSQPEASLSISDASVSEGDTGDSTLRFRVSLSQASSGTITVNYASADDTASAASDYDAASGSLTLSAGTTSSSINIAVHSDDKVEGDELLTVTLSGAINATISRAIATGTITDEYTPANPLSGLDVRPNNQTCIAPARPTVNASVSVVDPFPNLPNISQPTKMLIEPVANPRWFVLQKSGQLLTFDPENALSVSTYLDLSSVLLTQAEGGLLGMAFHPDYPNTPQIFLSYTIDHSGPPMRSVISRFILDNVTTPGAGTVEQVILQVDQDSPYHNGGDIAFGPDGYLYIGLGDGGSANRGQETAGLLGAMLRVDVNGPGVSFPTNPYDIPPDNPFAGNAECGPGTNANACPEIYAWGLRNPWRWSFDPDTGQLWLGDVGRSSREEVNLIERGGNYGWRCREGSLPYNTTGCGTGFVEPVIDYDRNFGTSITGGLVYRGNAIPELVGRYVFGDYGSGRIWALQPDSQGDFLLNELINTNFGPTSFAADAAGEIYFTDINNSRLRKIIAAGTGEPDTIPDLLSDTGCTDPADITMAYTGLVPYGINAPFWSDGALKERYLGLPNDTVITRNADGDWDFPNGTVIVKNFRLNGALIETRQLMRHPDGVWAGYTWEWNAQQTEATRIRGGKTVTINGQDWTYPSEADCMQCHTNAAGFSLGLETAQLNRDFTYAATQRTGNQLATLDHVMMFASPLPDSPAVLPRLATPEDSGATLEERARAYLHTNCVQCHRPSGPTPSTMDLRYDTALASTNACGAIPSQGDLGIANARLILPGNAARSLIVERAARRDSHGMPPLGSNQVDTAGIALLTGWINSLGSCN